MQYRFADLVDLPGFQQVMQSWYSVAGVATRCWIRSATACAPLAAGHLRRFHRLSPQNERRCNQCDDYLFGHLHDGPYVATKCSKGLMNCAMPVMVKGEHVATLFMVNSCTSRPTTSSSAVRRKSWGLTNKLTCGDW